MSVTLLILVQLKRAKVVLKDIANYQFLLLLHKTCFILWSAAISLCLAVHLHKKLKLVKKRVLLLVFLYGSSTRKG